MLVVIAIVSSGMASGIATKNWYESNYSGHAVCASLDSIKNGDSLPTVLRYFHGSEQVQRDDPFVQDVWEQNSWSIEPNDEFHHVLFDGEFGAYLQFRDGRLINHEDRYLVDERIRQKNNNSKPPMIFKFGLRPVHYGIWSLAIIAIIFCLSYQRKNIPQELDDTNNRTNQNAG